MADLIDPVVYNRYDPVVYHGYRDASPASDTTVAVEDVSGDYLGPLPHVVKHSPDGFNWGYGGSGPGELARCLLIDTLSVDAICQTCHGHAQVDGGPCPAECDEGYRPLPYQDFHREYVMTWAPVWRIRRAEIRDWLAGHGVLATS